MMESGDAGEGIVTRFFTPLSYPSITRRRCYLRCTTASRE